VLAGLSWLIVDHFIRLRSKYPEGWRNLATYPLKLICTVGLLLLVIVVAGTSMPSTVPLIPDPYTMWKTWKGEAVPTFYSGEVSADTVNARAYRSGYGRDDSTLGAGFDFDYTPVMQISTNHRSYWRGETRSYYTGEGWIESYSETLAQVQPVALDQPLKSFDLAPTVETTQLTATVTMRRNESYPVLFGAYSAQRLTQLDDAAKMGDISWKP
jgi:hypothetical protein